MIKKSLFVATFVTAALAVFLGAPGTALAAEPGGGEPTCNPAVTGCW